jgi:hypothetical protein
VLLFVHSLDSPLHGLHLTIRLCGLPLQSQSLDSHVSRLIEWIGNLPDAVSRVVGLLTSPLARPVLLYPEFSRVLLGEMLRQLLEELSKQDDVCQAV